MERDNVRYLPTPPELNPQQREYWLGQAGYWGVREEESMRSLEYAQRQREAALRMLGMLPIERGLQED